MWSLVEIRTCTAELNLCCLFAQNTTKTRMKINCFRFSCFHRPLCISSTTTTYETGLFFLARIYIIHLIFKCAAVFTQFSSFPTIFVHDVFPDNKCNVYLLNWKLFPRMYNWILYRILQRNLLIFQQQARIDLCAIAEFSHLTEHVAIKKTVSTA